MGFKTEISKFLIPFLFKQGFSNFPVCGINLIMWSSVSEVGPPRLLLFFHFLPPCPQCRLRSMVTLVLWFLLLGGHDRNSLLGGDVLHVCEEKAFRVPIYLIGTFAWEIPRGGQRCLAGYNPWGHKESEPLSH